MVDVIVFGPNLSFIAQEYKPMELTQNYIEKSGTDAVRALRILKLENGLPFMINDPELPSNQCYLEYPDGKIILVILVQHARILHLFVS